MVASFRIFSKEDLQKIHDKTLYLLEQKGIRVSHPKVLNYLAENGAIVDFETEQVRFPSDLVERCIYKVPKSVVLAGRDRRYDIIIPHPEGGFYTACATGPAICVDPKTGGHRRVEIADVREWVRLADALDNVDMVASPSPEDKPAKTRDIYAVKTMLENTSKHCMIQPFSEHSLKYHFKIALAVAGSANQLRERPFVSIAYCAFSPLSYKYMDIEAILMASNYDIPVQFAALPSSGATAPVTIGGTVLQCNVEVLAGIIIAQLIKPGMPIVYCPLQYTMDMSRGVNLQASVEALLAAVGNTQLAKEFYNFPTRVYGLNTDSPIPDGQSMLERGLETPIVSFAGADIVAGMGGIHCIGTMSTLQMVIDDELIGTLRRLNQKVDLDEESLAAELIAEVGPGGHFLDKEHTLRYFKRAYRPKIFSRMQLEEWKSEGAKNLNERARERLNIILSEHQAPLLPENVIMEINSIVKEADREIGNCSLA